MPEGVSITKAILHLDSIALAGVLSHQPPASATCKCASGKPHWNHFGRGSHIYRLPPIGNHPVILHLSYERWRCKHCYTHNTPYSGGNPQLPDTSTAPSLTRMIGEYAMQHSDSETARFFAVGLSVAQRCADVVAAAKMAERTVEAPDIIGIDDTRIASARRAVIVDIQRALHIDILPGYSREAISAFLAERRPEWEGVTRAVVIDQYEPFRLAISDAWPGLIIVLDRYHVARSINATTRSVTDGWRRHHRGAPSIKQLHTRSKDADFPAYREELRDRFPELVEAFEYSQAWQNLYSAPDVMAAKARWHAWADQMPPLLRPSLGKIVTALTHRWLDQITAPVGLHMPGMKAATNAVTEALNKRPRAWEVHSNLGFERLRPRLLLATSQEVLNREAKEREERLDQALQMLMAQ